MNSINNKQFQLQQNQAYSGVISMVIAGQNLIVYVVSPKRVTINDLLCTAYAGL